MVQIIGMWAIIGMILFINSNTQKIFKTKWASILAHGPLMWVVWLCYIGMKKSEEDE